MSEHVPVSTLPLFASAAYARAGDPETSKAAARSVDATTLAGMVLRELQRAPDGLTSHELADRLGLSLVTVSPRLAPLFRAGRVVRAGVRDKRTVWKVAP